MKAIAKPQIVYFSIALLSSVPFFVRHAVGGAFAASLYALALAALLAPSVTGRRAAQLANSRLLAGGAIVLLAAVNYRLFPRMRLVAHPSSAPDAMTQPIIRLLHGLEPYGRRLFDGAPISPGPGWIALNGGLTVSGLLPLMVPLWLALASWLMMRAGAKPARFVALVCAPLAFLQMSVVGHDIFAISLAWVSVTLAAFEADGAALILAALLAGAIATARLPLIVLPAIVGLALARERGVATGARFTAIAMATTALWHGVFWFVCLRAGDFYQPMHLFQRAHAGAGPWFTLAGALAGLAGVAWIYFKMPGDRVGTLLGLWLIQTCLFLPIGIGELVNAQHFDWANWEGKNYAAFPLPLLAAALSLKCASTRRGAVAITSGKTPAIPAAVT